MSDKNWLKKQYNDLRADRDLGHLEGDDILLTVFHS
jgi:hypothetical protein